MRTPINAHCNHHNHPYPTAKKLPTEEAYRIAEDKTPLTYDQTGRGHSSSAFPHDHDRQQFPAHSIDGHA